MKNNRFEVATFLDKCKEIGWTPPEDLFIRVLKLRKQGAEYIEVTDEEMKTMFYEKRKREEKENTYRILEKLRLNGLQQEKTNVDMAIINYAECIKEGEASGSRFFYSYAYAYERIIILLQKQHRYEEEISYINAYLKHNINMKKKDNYKERLEKLKEKMSSKQAISSKK
ncbi:MAG: hypothetical protein J6Y37_04980 [Paludibacteraceae bacterium]|nr:hypothetical protein [Paludibacteraceae bacterium]